jgi:hypothetical protein
MTATSDELYTPESTTPVSVFKNDDWATYNVELSFLGRLYGGSPFDPKLVEGWIGKNLGITNEEELSKAVVKHLAEVQGLDQTTATDEALAEAIEANAIEKKAQGFKRTVDGNRPFVEGRHLKAMIKENTNIAFPQGEHKWGRYANTTGRQVGGKAPISFVAERVWVPEQPVVVADDSDDFEFCVGHIEDWKGRRSTIGYFEFCVKPVITFQVQVLDDVITGDQWARIMRSAERNGLGARRSQGGGQFAVTGWEKV